MEKQSIYNHAVLMRDQYDCDLAKKLCQKYSLNAWNRSDAFDYAGDESYMFSYEENDEHLFYVDSLDEDELLDRGLTTVSLKRFEELAIELTIPEYESVEEIIDKLRELNYTINKPIP